MKIAGLTWWRNNYGSILQAYALQQYLNSFDDIEYDVICQYGKKIASMDNLMDKLRTVGIIETTKRIFWKFIIPNLRKRNQSIQNFVDEKIRVTAKSYNKDEMNLLNRIYDAFICGSDQIWNPMLESADSIYWLGFVDEGKSKIAYAPSFGVNSVDNETALKIRKNLKTFDAVSCREKQGTDALNRICKKDICTTVLDPTLLIDPVKWGKISGKKAIKGKYLFAYMLRGTTSQRKYIERYARKHNLKIVTMPFLDNEKICMYDAKFGDIKCWDADPAMFINLIRYADKVFTDSFHCMVFSIIYHRDFFVFPKIGKAQLNRMTGLMELFHTGNRMIDIKNDNFCDKLKKINWEETDAILKEKRSESEKYLNNALDIARGKC